MIVAQALGRKFWFRRRPIEFCDGLLRVFRDVDKHRAGTTAVGDQESFANGPGNILRLRNHHVVFSDGHGDACDIDLLKRVGAQDFAADLTCNADDRRRGHHGGSNPGNHVRCAGTGCSHGPARKAGLRWPPRGKTLLNLHSANIQAQLALGDVENNGIAVSDSRDRTAVGGFGSDVPGHKTVRGAGKSSVREQRDGIAQARADQRGGNREHFAHARATFRSLIANDDYVASFDGALLDGGEGRFFVVEYSCGTSETLQIVTRYFNHAALGSDISLQDNEAASGLEWRIEFADDFL